MDSNVIVFHIGTYKTGTTAIQTFLYNNEDNLREAGWTYPDIEGDLSHLDTVNLEKTKNGRIFFGLSSEIDYLSPNWLEVWDYILNCVKENNVIISSEEIFDSDVKAFFQEAKKMHNNIKAIVYLRRQDLFLESWYNQLVKGGEYECDTITKWISNRGIDNMSDMTHYLGKIDTISKIIGQKNIIVRVYEKEQLEQGDIAKDFLKAVGIETEGKNYYPLTVENESLSGNYLEIKRICNLAYRDMNKEMLTDVWRYTDILRTMSSKYSQKKSLLSCECRKQIMDLYEKENRIIAKKYLNREDGILFRNIILESKDEISQFSTLEADMLRYLITIICKQSEQMYWMNEKLMRYEELKYKWFEVYVDSLKKGKKIAFFGAGNKCKELLDNVDLSIDIILDNDKNKENQQIKNVLIKNIESISNMKKYFIVITCSETSAIEQQLILIGMVKNIDYILAKEFI